MPDPAWMEEIAKRAEAATLGPWINDAGSLYGSQITQHKWPDGRVYHESRNEIAGDIERRNCFERDEDAEFSAHARTDIPRLLKALNWARDGLKTIAGGGCGDCAGTDKKCDCAILVAQAALREIEKG